MTLFTSFEGRISRKGFWMGLGGIILLGLVSAYLVGALGADSSAATLTQLVLAVAMAYGWAAVLTKRLHDRGKPGLPWVAIFLAPGILLQGIGIFRIGFTPMELGGTVLMMPGALYIWISYVAMAVGFWMVVELGLLKGQGGANNYGPDPLAPVATPQEA